jgi:hypothetical protein
MKETHTKPNNSEKRRMIMKIQKNLGTVSRMVRIIAGAALMLIVPLAFVGPESRWAFLGLLGLFPLTAGLVGYCPRHAFVGTNTFPGKNRIDEEVEGYPETACC